MILITYERTELNLVVIKENIEIINLLLANNELDINTINRTRVDKERKEVYHSGMIINPQKANVITIESTTLYNVVSSFLDYIFFLFKTIINR